MCLFKLQPHRGLAGDLTLRRASAGLLLKTEPPLTNAKALTNNREHHQSLLSQRRSGAGLPLRKRIFRLSWIRGRHYYVLFGWPLVRLSEGSRYLKLRDLERRTGSELAGGAKAVKASRLATVVVDSDPASQPYYVSETHEPRLKVEDLIAELSRYDVVSFDIFDTAVFRCVENPSDVFRIMAARTGVSDFVRLRRNAETRARERNERTTGSREVTLADIYAFLGEQHAIDPGWAQVEAELEVQLSRPNPYIKTVYDALRAMNKSIVFMTDMYLPRDTIEAILAQAAYHGYEKIYLSHEHKKRKGDGSLQHVLLADCSASGKSAVHVGDSYDGDVQKSEAAGLKAIHNPDQRGLVREPNLHSLAGSVYRAVIGNTLDNGTWDRSPHYTHGFRVGGILALGFCEFIERTAAQKSIDKILFCGRDCDVISRLYSEHFAAVDSAYIDISRYAIYGVTLDRYFDEYVGRSFFRAWRESNNTKPLFQVMAETGFDYLIPHLETHDIERYLFSGSILGRRLTRFFSEHRDLVAQHNAESLDAARAYFSDAVGDAKRILVVDIGWTGTSANALRYFIQANLSGNREVYGALMCSSLDESVADAVAAGWLECYVYSPLTNLDLARAMMPGGRSPVRVSDRRHLPLEYLFTESRPTVTGYGRDASGRPTALRGVNQPRNLGQIADIQQGILDFAATYLEYTSSVDCARAISPYVAAGPLLAGIESAQYTYDVYKDFLYDATPALFGAPARWELFGELFESHSSGSAAVHRRAGGRGKILFISPEMVYAGAPRSLLRMCKVAIEMGFEPVVWTAKSGPFISEFEAVGLRVSVVAPKDLSPERVDGLIADGVKLAICNSVVTDGYVRALEGEIPLVWYIREAANLPDFFRSSQQRIETIASSRSICSVSEYAAEAIARYASHPIAVVRNSVEDVSDLALDYKPEKSRRHRFVQLGTIEHRKGYDVFIAAFKSLPAAYRERAELHFAGGFINTGSSFSSYVFGQMEGEPHIHYHGLISDDRKKIGLLSQMDTVVVASRDESCSLVALEGAMLSKPVIVTENVGAKYIVDSGNGKVVASGDVAALREAFMWMIDREEDELTAMGAASRRNYEQLASMDAYRRELGNLIEARIAAGTGARRLWPSRPASLLGARTPAKVGTRHAKVADIVVSLTSFPARMPFITECIDSLLHQTLAPRRVILWLSRDQFPERERELPASLLKLVGDSFEIRWVDGDLGPHKKYFYAAQQYPDSVLITVDDDAIYDDRLVEFLYEAHLEQPKAVICERANLVLFRPDGQIREYDSWVYDCEYLRGTLTYQLLPTGVGGVLYPPHCLPPETFDEASIRATCLWADDLWLKVMATANGYPVWMPRQSARFTLVQSAQDVGLWYANTIEGQNDVAWSRILADVDARHGFADDVMKRLRGLGSAGELLGADQIDLTPLFTSKDGANL